MNHDTLTRRGLLRQAAGAAALVSALHAQNQPAASAPRIRESFDFGWKFLKGDAPGAHQPDFSDSAWRALDLPHEWSIEGPFREQEIAQGSLPTGIGWYRKRFGLHESYKDRTVVIEFDGVYLAIVQSTAKSGRIQVTASSASLQSANLTISTRAMP